MIAHGKTVISQDLFEEQFVCDLKKCKGACCVEGDAGAPLDLQEVKILKEEYNHIKPFLRKEGIEAIEKQGTAIIDDYDGEFVTPLVNEKECAYVVFDDKGTTLCGIEIAWKEGKTSFRKPVSCHLYPIRIQSYPSFDAINYHKWEICSPACSLGKELKVPVYKFAKDSLIRKYGEDWYSELELIAEEWLSR
jgi:hypothetical protein